MLDSAKPFEQQRIHIDRNGISGPSYTAAEGFNKVISEVKTEWVCCGCDDDFFHTDNLTELLTWFHNTEVKEDIIYFPIFCGNERDGWKEQFLLTPTYEGLRKQNMLPFSCFYRKGLWEKIGGYDNIQFCDWGFWMKALKVGATLYRWEKPISYFRQGIEERLSDKEYKSQDFEKSRQQLLERADNYVL